MGTETNVDTPLKAMGEEGKIEEIENPTTPRWCPEQQIYVGGAIPRAGSHDEVATLMEENDGVLRIFGYGSLCWNPGPTGSALSKFDEGVTRSLGRAIGWRRCWAQKSADHRGTPSFLGIVCTLLTDEEVATIRSDTAQPTSACDDNVASPSLPSMTEGMIYNVPPHLTEECLSELDFREKGGYSRDVIDVLDDTTGEKVRALLYRGGPDNPAFWRRALLDLPYAAARMAMAVGPSGPNDEYLFQLDTFLEKAVKQLSLPEDEHTGDSDTRSLAVMVRFLKKKFILYSLFGSGSNQHGQLLLRPKSLPLGEGDDVHDMTDIIFGVSKKLPSAATSSLLENRKNDAALELPMITPKSELEKPIESETPLPVHLYAGGGHSALLMSTGTLYLWGWNEMGQLGLGDESLGFDSSDDDHSFEIPMAHSLKNICVSKASLGHSHTLVLEQDVGNVYAFGDNTRGQVCGSLHVSNVTQPIIPSCLRGRKFIDVAAGLFHSAAITFDGELITFGCGKSMQCLPSSVSEWRPDDGSCLIQVACGRRHTVVLDDQGRVWTMGSNDYGQLGRQNLNTNEYPALVSGLLDNRENFCFDVQCGWSHTTALFRQNKTTNSQRIMGWGRNDRSQLGLETRKAVKHPEILFEGGEVLQCSCGAESTMLIDKDGSLWGCGWNEHGNLGVGTGMEDVVSWKIVRAGSASRLGINIRNYLLAAGGAHFLAKY